MKEYITYFYNINVNDISYSNGNYTFSYNRRKYILKKCTFSNVEMYYTHLAYQIKDFSSFFKIVKNRNNRLISVINGQQYVLLYAGDTVDNMISIDELSQHFYVDNTDYLSTINHFPWYKFWKEKIDYMEKWFESKREKYKELLPWFNYYVGLGENALMYIRIAEIDEVKKSCDRLCIQHYRVSAHTKKYEYYDPLNIIIDHSSRDIGEYIKSSILEEKLDINRLFAYLKSKNISKYWLKMLYGRILFPSFFFDYIEKLESNESERIHEYDIKKTIINITDGLKKITVLFNEKFNIDTIDWIKKT